ncbi:MAG: leucine-rich repeat domain-containing protein, partial [Methanomassiliicoccaceae archaeon]|nr:leucine-rich repeat domain-containing protein [Methanomassiliicoccaceae archaeon]
MFRKRDNRINGTGIGSNAGRNAKGIKKVITISSLFIVVLIAFTALSLLPQYEAEEVTISADGETFTQNGVEYRIMDEANAEVTIIKGYQGTASPSGDYTVPSYATYKGKTYTVTSIYKEAYRYSYNMTSLTISDSVIYIGDYAFSNCTRLISVHMPASVSIIAPHAFDLCPKLGAIALSVNTAESDIWDTWIDPDITTLVYYDGAAAAKAVKNGNDITVKLTPKQSEEIHTAAVGTTKGGFDIPVTGSDNEWTFTKQTAKKYYITANAEPAKHKISIITSNGSANDRMEYDIDNSGTWKIIPEMSDINVPYGSSVQIRPISDEKLFIWTHTENVSSGVLSFTPVEDLTIDAGIFFDVLIHDPDDHIYDGTEHEPAVHTDVSDDHLNYCSIVYNDNVNAGTASITITGNGICVLSKTIYFTIHKAEGSGSVSIDDWIYGNSPSTPIVDNVNAAYVTISFKADFDWTPWSNVTKELPAGDYELRAIFSATGNYNEFIFYSVFTIHKAQATDDPDYEEPALSQITYDPLRILSDIELPKGWSWINGGIIPTVNCNMYEATYHSAEYNYEPVTKMLLLTVKALVLAKPAALQTSFVYDGSEHTLTLNNFDASTMNITGDKGTSSGNYVAYVSLNDTENYAWIDETSNTFEIKWKIEKADPNDQNNGDGRYSEPELSPITYDPNRKLSDIELPEGWAWVNGNETPIVRNNGYEATYTPLDDNYEVITKTIALTVKPLILEKPTGSEILFVYD